MFDTFELNKIIGAVLLAFLVIIGVGVVSGVIFSVEAPETPGYAIEGAEETHAAAATVAEEAVAPLAERLAAAHVEKGQTVAKKCAACHTFEAGGPNRVGPNLHGVVGRPVAAVEGFAYSDALKAQEGAWTYEKLFDFLESPRNAIPGTAMAFAGIRIPDDRADLIVYLKSISPDAPPLPEEAAQSEAEPQPERVEQPQAETRQQQEPEAQQQPQQETQTAPAKQTKAEESPLAQRLEEANAEKGQKVARKCAACHTFEAGGPNRVGPNLHGIVGRPVASHEGFSYSSSLKEKGGSWTYEALDQFVEAPRKAVPGTAMAFAGIRIPDDRADLIAYLKSISPDAPPLPQ
jgi:cytochrome c